MITLPRPTREVVPRPTREVVRRHLVRRATAGLVCEALLAALRRHGIPDQILTDIQWQGLYRPVWPCWQCGGGVVRPDLRRERDPASVDRAAVADHDGEGGAVAQDDTGGVPRRP
jgi:hypothetical protein